VTTQEVLSQLEALGTEQTRKTLRRHGISGEAFGVLYSELYKLQKKIKVNHALAKELWATGNHDARILALLIADPNALTDAEMETWMSEANNHVLSSAIATLISNSPRAQAIAEQWMNSEEEWRGSAGWIVFGSLLRQPSDLPDSYFEAALATIEREIHSRPNRIRESMNSALINIGVYNEALREKALAAASRIGKVHVDHGDTSCKTPDAVPYILNAVEKLAARKKK
jgi:3-methyladenine DNA glycosylase AlkD